MTSERWIGACPRSSRGAIAARVIILSGFCLGATGAFAAKAKSIDFRGELSYETFKRAAKEGVTIRIKNSPGGTGASAMVLGRARGLVIDGPCNSACAWAFVRNKSACFTRRASFGFHGAHDPGTGRRLPAATDYWLSTVGGSLRARLAALRTSSSVIRVSASEMMRYYGDRACNAGSPRVEVAQSKAHSGKAALAAPQTAAPRSTSVSAPGAPRDSQQPGAGAVSAVTFTEAEVGAAVEALRNDAFEDSSVVIASLLSGGARHTLATAETREATAESVSVAAQDVAATAAVAESLLGELMPSLGLAFPSTATMTFGPVITVSCGGVLASAIGDNTELAERDLAVTGEAAPRV